MNQRRIRLAGWGNFRPAWCDVVCPQSSDELSSAIIDRRQKTWISRGLGRSYGDSSINANGGVVDHTARIGILEFNSEKQTIRAEAGISLGALTEVILPHGYFLPVSPGTKYVTLGGAVAADIHGKNHHRDGSISAFVDEMTLLLPSGERVVCGPGCETDLFYATVGGMGLTGAIVDVTLRLLPVESAFIRATASRTRNLKETLNQLEATAAKHRYSVSWIDALATGASLGRGWVLAGDHAKVEDLAEGARKTPFTIPVRSSRNVPFFFPRFALNRWTCKLFNQRVYDRGIIKGSLVDMEEFFYPLDRVLNWNRIYGRAGFIQYQALFPFATAYHALSDLLQMIEASGHAAFFAGIKSAGPASGGILSFLSPGFTIGVDLPSRPGIELLVKQMDSLVIENAGRVYLAKDSLLTAESFRQMYPEWKSFMASRRRVDPEGRIASDQSRRLGLTVDGPDVLK